MQSSSSPCGPAGLSVLMWSVFNISVVSPFSSFLPSQVCTCPYTHMCPHTRVWWISLCAHVHVMYVCTCMHVHMCT